MSKVGKKIKGRNGHRKGGGGGEGVGVQIFRTLCYRLVHLQKNNARLIMDQFK